VEAVQSELNDVLRDSAMRPAAVPVLEHLLAAPEQRVGMTELAAAVRITPGSMVKLADWLGRSGFVDRRNNPADPNGDILVILTPEGQRQAERSGQLMRMAAEHLMRPPAITQAELRVTAEILTCLADAAT
jgi:DNA-binding MarR family transcriptional regulator